MQTQDVELIKLRRPASQPTADPARLARHGSFDRNKYTPIIVEQDGNQLTIQDGVTRVENAQNAGVKKLPAYVFIKR